MAHFFIRPLALAGCVTFLLAHALGQEGQTKPSPSSSEAAEHTVVSRIPADMLVQLSGSLQQLAAKVSPAVVQIQVTGFGPAEESGRADTALIVRQHALGSGVMVDSDGYIMTNAHVVEGAQRIRVVLPVPPASSSFEVTTVGRAQVFDAKVIGIHKESDLALLKIEGTNLPTLPLNPQRLARPGELVFAIGSPEGLQNSVTMGVVSSVWRQPDPDKPMVYIQTDAPINPGNSGGPLVDVDGDIVGLNTFILSSGGGSEGLGFAIPARIVSFVYQSLKKYGHVHRIEIGAVAQTITPDLAAGLALAQNWGVIISDVTPHGPADAAGIKAQDIILAVDGRPVLGLPGFAAALYLHPTDRLLRIDVLRGAEKLSLNVAAVQARDRMDQLADVTDPRKSHIGRLGIFGLDFNDELRSILPDLRIASGVVVIGQATQFNSANTGLRTGDVIHALNRTPIDSLEQLRSAVAQLKAGDPVVLRIERRGQLQYLAFEME